MFDYGALDSTGKGSSGSFGSFGSSADSAENAQARRLADYKKSDWRDAYLPGRDLDTVMGIDIETTGTDLSLIHIY